MADPYVDVQFSTGTVITSEWLNGINDTVGQHIIDIAAIEADLAEIADLNTIPAQRYVLSIAALKLLDKTKYGLAQVAGYYTAGDRGGGVYYLDSADTTSVDNGGTVIVANDGGRLKLIFRGYISVRQFGAKGDGVTDDTAAINNTILALEALGGGTAYFPATDYNNGKWYRTLGSVFVSGTADIRLLGDSNTMIKSHATTAVDMVVAGDPSNVSQRSAFVIFQGLRLWGATGTNGNGIRARKLTNLRVYDCSLFNHGLNGAQFSDTYTFKMINTESVGNGQNGLYCTDAAANNSTIQGCRFNDNDTVNMAGVRIEGLHYNVILDKNDFEFNHYGAFIDGSHAVSVTQNYFELNNAAAVYIPPGSTARGVSINQNSVFSTLIDVNNVAGVQLEGNVFEAGGTVVNVGNCTEVDIGTNSFPGGGSIATNDVGRTDFSAFGTWTTYTPVWTASTAPSIGNGTLTGSFKRIGKTCFLRVRWAAGSTTTFGTGAWLFSLPFQAVNVGQAEWYGTSKHNNGANTKLNAIVPIVQANLSTFSLYNATDGSAVTNTSPAVWANGDAFQINIIYETV